MTVGWNATYPWTILRLKTELVSCIVALVYEIFCRPVVKTVKSTLSHFSNAASFERLAENGTSTLRCAYFPKSLPCPCTGLRTTNLRRTQRRNRNRVLMSDLLPARLHRLDDFVTASISFTVAYVGANYCKHK